MSIFEEGRSPAWPGGYSRGAFEERGWIPPAPTRRTVDVLGKTGLADYDPKMAAWLHISERPPEGLPVSRTHVPPTDRLG